MFAITADQRASRTAPDLVPAALTDLRERHGPNLLLPPDQNAGDEIQVITTHARTALDIVLTLTRSRQWSVGLGLGGVEDPLPAATRMTRGSALTAARAAVDAAKRHPTRSAVRSTTQAVAVDDADAWLALLIALRDKRTDQGWELFDLIHSGLNQTEAAATLGITPQAVGHRMSAAAIKVERAADQAMIRALENADAASSAATAETEQERTGA